MFGVIQICIGMLAIFLADTVVQNALTIAGYSAGLLLGVFLLGVLTKVEERAALLGAVFGLATLLFVQFLLPRLGPTVAWPWYALIGASTTFGFGCLLNQITKEHKEIVTS